VQDTIYFKICQKIQALQSFCAFEICAKATAGVSESFGSALIYLGHEFLYLHINDYNWSLTWHWLADADNHNV